jgi:hypothetical protein
MADTLTTEPANKRPRNGNVILTDRMCERRVDKRIKMYDRKASGLYVSIIPRGTATFNFRFSSGGRQRTAWLGQYNPETFTVEHARSRVYALKGMGGSVVAETLRQQKAQAAKWGRTVDEIIDERIEWMKTPVRKADGEDYRYLLRFIFGRKKDQKRDIWIDHRPVLEPRSRLAAMTCRLRRLTAS